MFTRAITRQPGPGFAKGISTSSLGAPDYTLAHLQHRRYVDTLKAIGLAVIELTAEREFPDACFVEDVAVLTPEVLILTNPGAASRRDETVSMAPVLERLGSLVRIEAPGTMDGGDVLLLEREFYVGISQRTNEQGAEQFGSIVAEHGYGCTTVRMARGLHFKSDVNTLGNGVVLLTTEFADHPALEQYEKIVVDDDEAYAANTLWINEHVITPTGFPKTRAKLDGLDCEIIELDVSEFQKMDGGLTCLSLRF